MKKNQEPKLPKHIDQTFVDEINSMSVDELKARIVTLQVQNQANEEFKASDAYLDAKDEFDQAKDVFDIVDGPVKDTTTAIKNKTKLIVDRLKEKGAV